MLIRSLVLNPADDLSPRLEVVLNSIQLAGLFGEVVENVGNVLSVLSVDDDFCHVLTTDTIVLPGFYDALIEACEYAKTDYALCSCASLFGGDNDPTILQGSPVCSQMLVRTWVLREIGPMDSMESLINAITANYNGTVVRHVLCVRIGLVK